MIDKMSGVQEFQNRKVALELILRMTLDSLPFAANVCSRPNMFGS